MKLIFRMLINMKAFYKVIIFDGFGQACPKHLGKFVVSLWHLKKKVKNEARDFALASSNIAVAIH